MKLRIYELAKELGVDNKVVITKAAELGFPGKVSHSNTLDSSEVEAIRRAILRKSSAASADREVVTQRVDKLTGETSSVVEKRTGNVIRRRRSEDTPAPEVQQLVAETEETAAQESAQEASLQVEAAPSIQQEGQQEGQEERQEHGSVEQAEQVLEVEPVAEVQAASPKITASPVAQSEQAAATPPVQAKTPTKAEPRPEVRAPTTPARVIPRTITPASSTSVHVTASTAADFAKKGVGPKILGKIELVKRAVPSPTTTGSAAGSAVRRPGFGPSAPTRSPTAVFEDEDVKKMKSLKGKKARV